MSSGDYGARFEKRSTHREPSPRTSSNRPSSAGPSRGIVDPGASEYYTTSSSREQRSVRASRPSGFEVTPTAIAAKRYTGIPDVPEPATVVRRGQGQTSSTTNLRKSTISVLTDKRPPHDVSTSVTTVSKEHKEQQHAHPTSGGGGGGGKQGNSIEEEYIYNLQQQIYFLELEMKFLKDKATEGPALRNEGTNTISEADIGLSEAGTVNEHITQIKLQYVKMQRELEQQVKEYKQQVIHLEKEKKLNDREKEKREKENELLKKAVNELKTELIATKQLADQLSAGTDESHKKIMSDLNRYRDDYQKTRDALMAMRTDYERYKATASVDVETARKAQAAAEKNVIARDVDIDKLKTELSQLQLKLSDNTQLGQAEKEVHRLEQANRKLERELSDAKYHSKDIEAKLVNLQKDRDELVMKTIEMKTNMDALTSKLSRQEESMNANIHKRLKVLESEHIIEADRKVRQSMDRQRFLEEDINMQISRYIDLVVKFNKRETEFQELTDALKKSQIETKDSMAKLDALMKEHTTTEKTSKELDTKYKALSEDHEKMSKHMAELEKANEEMRASLEVLQSKVEISEELDALNIDELKMIYESNKQVANSFESIMDKMKKINKHPVPKPTVR
eukprot:GILK01004041.1.p1 GENE.GILK01004041.1~~GILK01004041.1.p1  ORF type:complete len:624 (+),score=160.16 GILK01004041.1:120-1991(+)